MPQKGYIMNKKKLPKLQKSETSKEPTDDESEQEAGEASPEIAKEEIFSLYVRGAAWIKDRDNAERLLKEIEPRIQSVRHPRQKSADYCFILFSSASERDQAHDVLKNHEKLTVRPVTTDVPAKLDKRQQKIAEKREAKKETRKLLAKIKKNEKLNTTVEKTNQLIIANVPKQTTAAELKEQFSKSVKIDLKTKNKIKNTKTAIITFPSPNDAVSASKLSIVLHGHKLNAFLNTNDSFKQQKSKRKAPAKLPDDDEPASKSAKVKAK